MVVIFELTNPEHRDIPQALVDLDVLPERGQRVRFDGAFYRITEVVYALTAADSARGRPAHAEIVVRATA